MESTQVFVSVQNQAPTRGTALSPFWVGFHNGEFDTYDRGRPASEGLERLAEDGMTEAISTEFEQSTFGDVQGVVAGEAGPIFAGESAGQIFNVDDTEQGQYFNYASMLLPSNDFFIANGNPLAHKVFDDDGSFIGADFVVPGAAVLDAGTEVSDEVPENTAFLGQMTPDTGVEENGVVQAAEGFIEGGNILRSDEFSNADFTAEGYEVARIRVLKATVGTGEDDMLRGSAVDDYLGGGSGDDTLIGRQGNDILAGGRGNDYLAGRFGDDELIGGYGNDTLRGGSGNDILDGGAGHNMLFGGAGDDIFRLSADGFATIRSFFGGDRIELGAGLQQQDLTFRQDGNDAVISNGESAIAIAKRATVAQIESNIF